jgi:hypothetical protein
MDEYINSAASMLDMLLAICRSIAQVLTYALSSEVPDAHPLKVVLTGMTAFSSLLGVPNVLEDMPSGAKMFSSSTLSKDCPVDLSTASARSWNAASESIGVVDGE